MSESFRESRLISSHTDTDLFISHKYLLSMWSYTMYLIYNKKKECIKSHMNNISISNVMLGSNKANLHWFLHKNKNSSHMMQTHIEFHMWNFRILNKIKISISLGDTMNDVLIKDL